MYRIFWSDKFFLLPAILLGTFLYFYNLDKHQTTGSLEIDHSLRIPKYLTAYDIHQQPGGYHSESIENDI